LLALIARYRGSGGGVRWFGVACNFEPSCSAYAEEAIRRFGARRGLCLALGRVRRCNRRDLPARLADPVPGKDERC
jgi:hypothetical protein